MLHINRLYIAVQYIIMLQVTRNPNSMGAFGNYDIILNTDHLSRKTNLVTRVTTRFCLVDTSTVSFRFIDRFHFDGSRDFHSNNQRTEETDRTIHRDGLRKTRFDQRPNEAGYQSGRQDGWSYWSRSNPIFGVRVIRVKGSMLCQFFSAAGQQCLGVGARSKDSTNTGRLADEILSNIMFVCICICI